jgi:hypothetical protein
VFWYSSPLRGAIRYESHVARLLTVGPDVWAVATQSVVPEAVTNHDDFGGVFCGALSSLHDLLADAGVPVPASWLPLTYGRDAPAGQAFDRSVPTSGLVTVDEIPMTSFFWRGDRVSAGVGIRGWTAVGFAFPSYSFGRIALESVQPETADG